MSGCSPPASSNTRAVATAFLAVAVGLLGACVHGPFPNLPHSWESGPVQDDETSPDKLQVIITYAAGSCTHSAVRLESRDRPDLLWDPGGGWGLNEHSPHEVVRKLDVIQQDAPELASYIDYRWRLGDLGVEVFEWPLDENQAKQLYALLSGEGQHGFDTDRASWTCSLAVGDFLQQHGQPAVRTRDRHFLPHRMSADLYRENPGRVLIFRRDETARSLRPPPGY